MKNQIMLLFVLCFIAIPKGFAQSATDFYAGKWEVSVVGSPRGDVKFATDLVRKDGKLTGVLADGDEKRPITKIEESPTKLAIFFMSSQGGEISIDLDKINNDTLKGNLMSFTAMATRVKAQDFFTGKWDMVILGTPNGDAKMVANINRKDGKLTGELSDPSGTQQEKIPITNIEEEASKITIYFTTSGYDVHVVLDKIDDDNMNGKLMNMFETTAKRIK